MDDGTAAAGTTIGGGADEVLDEVFLTPRIVDRRTLDDYADELKALIRGAADGAAQLGEHAARTGELETRLGALTGDVRSKLEAVSKLLPMLDERIRRCEGVLSRAVDEAALARQAEGRIEELIERALGQAQTRLEGAVESAAGVLETRLAAHRSSLEAMTDEAEAHVREHAERAADEAEARVRAQAQGEREQLEALEARAQALHTDVDETLSSASAELDTKVRQASGTVQAALKGACAELDTKANMAKSACEHATERLEGSRAAMDEDLENAARRVATLLEEADVAVTRHGTTMRTLSAEGERQTGELEARVASLPLDAGASLEALCDRAERALASARDEQQGLGALLDRLDRAQASSDRVVREQESLRQQAELTRGMLGDALLDATSGVDEILTRHERLMRDLAGTDQRVSACESSAQGARQVAEAAAERVRELTETPMAEYAARVEEAGTWLSQLIEQSQSHGAALRDVLEELRPWRETLLETPRPSGPLRTPSDSSTASREDDGAAREAG